MSPAALTLIALYLMSGVNGLQVKCIVHGDITEGEVWVGGGRAWLSPPRALVAPRAEDRTLADDKLLLGQLLERLAGGGPRREILAYVIDSLCQDDAEERPTLEVLLAKVYDKGDCLYEEEGMTVINAAKARLELLGIEDAERHLETCHDFFEAEQCVFAGADVNSVVEGQPLLVGAVRSGDGRRVAVLVEAEADPNVMDGAGRSALWWAVELGHASLVGYLVDAGGDVELADHEGVTPKALAQKAGKAEILSLLGG